MSVQFDKVVDDVCVSMHRMQAIALGRAGWTVERISYGFTISGWWKGDSIYAIDDQS